MRLELINEVLSYEPTGELRVFVLFQLATALYEVFEPEQANDDDGRSAPTRPRRCGTPAWRSRWPGGASPGRATSSRPDAPGARSYGVRTAPPERLHRRPRAGVPQRDPGSSARHTRPRPRWSSWRAGRSPACARWSPTRSSSPVTPTRRTPCWASRLRPAPASTPCSPATACGCWCWPRPAPPRRSAPPSTGSRSTPGRWSPTAPSTTSASSTTSSRAGTPPSAIRVPASTPSVPSYSTRSCSACRGSAAPRRCSRGCR